MEQKYNENDKKMNYSRDSECAAYIQHADWSKHPLGETKSWPESLKTTIGIVLNGQLPMLLLWGPEQYIFYNDAYKPSLGHNGEHPKAIGQRTDAFWSSTWPSQKQILVPSGTANKTCNIQDHPLPLFRNNQLEEAYWTFNSTILSDHHENPSGILVTCFETTEKVLALRKLQSDQNTITQVRTTEIYNTEERLRLATEATGIGSWDLDLSSRNIIYTPTLMEIFGFQRNAVLDLAEIYSQICPEDRVQMRQNYSRALLTGHYHSEVRIQNEDRSERWINITARLLLDENNKPVRMLGICSDITESKIQQLHKNDFIALASHELKTPLTSIKAYIQLLRMDRNCSDMAAVKDLAFRAEHQVNKMTRLIYSFMDIFKIQSGHLDLTIAPFSLDETITEIAADFQSRMTSHTIIFKPGVSVPLTGDKARIGQVLENLISNAIKYSPLHQSVEISSWTTANEALVSVRDYGIGIDPKNQEKVFENFYRAADEKAINASGFGIGLYISADILKKHGGEIWVDSEAGRGSVFYISLPLFPEK